LRIERYSIFLKLKDDYFVNDTFIKLKGIILPVEVASGKIHRKQSNLSGLFFSEILANEKM
jgi:hypothetical protein